MQVFDDEQRHAARCGFEAGAKQLQGQSSPLVGAQGVNRRLGIVARMFKAHQLGQQSHRLRSGRHLTVALQQLRDLGQRLCGDVAGHDA